MKKLLSTLLVIVIAIIIGTVFFINNKVEKFSNTLSDIDKSNSKSGFTILEDKGYQSNFLKGHREYLIQIDIDQYKKSLLDNSQQNNLTPKTLNGLDKLLDSWQGYQFQIKQNLASLNLPLIGYIDSRVQVEVIKDGKKVNDEIPQELIKFIENFASYHGKIGLLGINLSNNAPKIDYKADNLQINISPIEMQAYIPYNFKTLEYNLKPLNVHYDGNGVVMDIQNLQFGYNAMFNENLIQVITEAQKIREAKPTLEQEKQAMLSLLSNVKNSNVSVHAEKLNLNVKDNLKEFYSISSIESKNFQLDYGADFNDKFTYNVKITNDASIVDGKNFNFNLDLAIFFNNDLKDVLNQMADAMFKPNEKTDEGVGLEQLMFIIKNKANIKINKLAFNPSILLPNRNADDMIELDGSINVNNNSTIKTARDLRNPFNLIAIPEIDLNLSANPETLKLFGLPISDKQIKQYNYNPKGKNNIKYSSGKLTINDKPVSLF